MEIGKKMFLIIFLLSQLFIRCSSDDNCVKVAEREMTEEEVLEINQLSNFLSEDLGITLKKIIYSPSKSAFVIDGDILMPLEDARQRLKKTDLKITDKANQRVSKKLIAPQFASSIQVYIYPEVPLEWRNAINESIKNWNNANTNLNLTVVKDQPLYGIKITMFDGGNIPAIAYGSLPSGLPGDSITINTYYNNLEESKKINALTHEFGHCFGLLHTNDTDAALIPCTPVSEMNSVMFSLNQTWNGFTYYDNVAISTLYPVGLGTKKMYTFRKNKSFLYSSDPCEINPEKNDCILQEEACYLYSTQVEGTVPLYRSYDADSQGHQLSRVQTSTDDVIQGYLYPTQQPGTTPLYRVTHYEFRPQGNIYHYLYTTEDWGAPFQIITGYVIKR